jgi:hypothetical protein
MYQWQSGRPRTGVWGQVGYDSVQTALSLPSDFRQHLLEVGQLENQVDDQDYKQNDSTHKFVRNAVTRQYNHESSDHAGKGR